MSMLCYNDFIFLLYFFTGFDFAVFADLQSFFGYRNPIGLFNLLNFLFFDRVTIFYVASVGLLLITIFTVNLLNILRLLHGVLG